MRWAIAILYVKLIVTFKTISESTYLEHVSLTRGAGR